MAEPSHIPAARAFHKTVAVGDSSLYTWAGMVPKLPQVHSSPMKTACLSKVELFRKDTGEWVQQATSGMPPLGVYGYGCAAVDDDLHFFGGVCGHGDCYHNCVHKLDVVTLEWEVLSPTMSREGIPLKKAHCGMVAFKDDHNSMLFVVGGIGTNPTYRQPGSNYKVCHGRFWCNEQHIFTLNKKEWNSPDVVGQPPPPSEQFTLTLVGERKAALFGGWSESGALNDLLIVELSRLTVHWTKIVRRAGIMSIFSRELWPEERQGHAAVCLCSSVLMIMGGRNKLDTIRDCWIYDLTTEIWKKVALPESVTSRMHHSLSVLQISPLKMLLVVFGGRRSSGLSPISDIDTIELIQEGNCQWKVGKIVDVTSHADKMAYKKILDDRNLFEGSIDGQILQRVTEKLEKEKKQLQQKLQQRINEIEQKLTRDIQRLMHEKEQIQQHLFDTEHALDQMRLRSQRIEERARQTEQQLSSELDQSLERNEQLTAEKEQLAAEKEQLTTEKDQVIAEKDQVIAEKDQVIAEKDQVTVENEQLAAEVVQLQQRANNMEARMTRRYQEHQEELRAANEREAQSRNQVRELQQQLGEGTEGPSHWVVRRDEVEVTEEIIGRGSWGEVKVANLRGLRVAAKCIHEVIISDHNLRLFRREMTIASLVRHPNMLLFIGATREGVPMILTELMDTSLRRELSKREFSRADIVSIGEDVACALCYLHEWQPSSIIHRDISSSNVLLEPLPNNRWRAKVSDYGSANFMYAIRTGNPGGPLYAAPESSNPDQHSPKMDTFSFGILLVEICLRELPERNPALREAQIMRVQWEAMVFLVRWCINDNPANRPTMRVVMNLLVGTIDE